VTIRFATNVHLILFKFELVLNTVSMIQMRTPLHWSVYGKHVLASQWLLRNGANQGALDAEQCLPLHWAALKGAVNVMVHMMDSGGRQYLSARDCTGATPAQLALQKNFRAIHDYLETERAHYISTWFVVFDIFLHIKLRVLSHSLFFLLLSGARLWSTWPACAWRRAKSASLFIRSGLWPFWC
jgi:ankyrin repeat protein